MPGSSALRWTILTVMVTRRTAEQPALRAVRTGSGRGRRPGAPAPDGIPAQGTGAQQAAGADLAGGPSEEGGPSQLSWVIANHVRSRRREIGLNVGQLAERSGISKGMLSKIENAQTSPSLSTIERLATALDMPVTSLFRGLAEERDAVFVKAGSGPEIVRQGTRAGHAYQLLGSMRGPYKRVEPLLVTLTERTEVFPLFQHPGIEILYLLQGVMEYSYGTQRYVMENGDTLQFEGDIPHGPTGLVELPIRFLSITVFSVDRS